MHSEFIFFACFLLFIGCMLAIDLGVFNKKQHTVGFKEAAIMSAIWVSFALGFYVLLLFKGDMLHRIQSADHLQQVTKLYGQTIPSYVQDFGTSLQYYRQNLALEFITGYVVEYALSVDNIFVMVLIFSAFSVEEKYYHRVLFWGIIGALCLRFLFIFTGAVLLAKFSWVMYVFGAFLVYTGVKILFTKQHDEEINPSEHPIVKFLSRFFNVYHRNVIGRFFVRMKTGKLFITPIFVIVVVIAFTDILFAVDSIPAIFSISKDPYIVFFSNVFAVMGLRSLFFFLSNLMGLFRFLPMGLGVLLSFVGLKMLGHHYLTEIGFGTLSSLAVIVGILATSIILSLLFPEKKEVH